MPLNRSNIQDPSPNTNFAPSVRSTDTTFLPRSVEASTAALRIAFAFDPDRSGILLVGGDKSGVSKKRFYKQLIEKADQLYAEHLAALKAKKKGKK